MESALLPHLFRSEYSKITAVLCKYLGPSHLAEAEDIASETFLQAMENWSFHDLPPNPVAWLYRVAKNKAINHIRRNNLLHHKIIPGLQVEEYSPLIDIDLSEENIADSQLRMLFAVCHPALPAESQIGLALRILGGFGIEEIATAFLSNKEAINKRLFRAREKIKEANIDIEMPGPKDIDSRLQNVLTTIYLIFSEGYYSESRDEVLRRDFCLEAMRLNYLLIQYAGTNQPPVNALMALMCFHASRFDARKNQGGELILYNDQDVTLWNQELILRGAYYLRQAATGKALTHYHLEANIAWWHTVKNNDREKWANILSLYNQLLQLCYSPVAALNRTYALSKVHGNTVAVTEALKLQLVANPYYHTLLGELYLDTDPGKAKIHYQQAFSLAKTSADRVIIERKLESL